MSPELINSRNGARGYDGKQVDVWASGVLLIVMLLGTFPFDHTENPDPNTSEAHLEVWCGHRWARMPLPVYAAGISGRWGAAALPFCIALLRIYPVEQCGVCSYG